MKKNHFTVKHGFRKLTALFIAVSLFVFAFNDIYVIKASDKKPVVIAVIDTGANYEHEALCQYIWTNPGEIPGNNVDDDGNGYVDDIFGWDFYNNDATIYHDVIYGVGPAATYEDDHGTHIAGIIASVIKEEQQLLSGYDISDIRIMVLKVNGGEKSVGKSAGAVKAIKYAERMGADICNISWGSYTDDAYLREVISSSHMLFVCSAGNEGSDNDISPVFPASYDLANVISVTDAKVTDGTIEIIGNTGKKSVTVCAPGEEIKSSYSHGYGEMSGTSTATAYVSGVAGAVMSAYGLKAEETKKMIVDGSVCKEELENRITNGMTDFFSTFDKMSEINEPELLKESNAYALLLNYSEVTVKKGKGIKLETLLLPAGSNARISFSTDNSEAVSVYPGGTVIAKKVGTAYVTVETDNGIKAFCKVNVVW